MPADLRLIRARSLQIEEAALTGESVPVEKGIEPVAAEAPLGDRSSMAFSGTFVTYGQATGVVVATGTATEIGRISALLGAVEPLTHAADPPDGPLRPPDHRSRSWRSRR